MKQKKILPRLVKLKLSNLQMDNHQKWTMCWAEELRIGRLELSGITGRYGTIR